jgi:hypothetical protein
MLATLTILTSSEPRRKIRAPQVAVGWLLLGHRYPHQLLLLEDAHKESRTPTSASARPPGEPPRGRSLRSREGFWRTDRTQLVAGRTYGTLSWPDLSGDVVWRLLPHYPWQSAILQRQVDAMNQIL